jgi:adenine/guanine phosphoribosyltransferase-like PRPP-binding protein
LSANIAEHASLPIAQDPGRECFGVIAMRFLKGEPEEQVNWLVNTFGEATRDFIQAHTLLGFAEICVCDPGIGIASNLRKEFIQRIQMGGANRDQHSGQASIADILQFAFDELGSSKSSDELEWMTNAHALSRILGLTSSYGGILRLSSDGLSMMYRFDRYPLTSCSSGIGYRAHDIKACTTNGTAIQLLIPMSRPRRVPAINPPLLGQTNHINSKIATSLIRPLMISICLLFPKDSILKPKEFSNCALKLGKLLYGANNKRTIVLDFSFTSWREDDLARLLDAINNVTRSRRVVMINLRPDLAAELTRRVRESVAGTQFYLAKETPIAKPHVRRFLEFLLDFNRVLPACDSLGKIYWLGAINESLETALNVLLDESGSLDTICNHERFARDHVMPPIDVDLVNVLAASQNIWFVPYWISDDVQGWRSIVDRVQLKEFHGSSLVTKLAQYLGRPCQARWGDDGKSGFLLPHSRKRITSFIECTRLLQEEEFAFQVGETFAQVLKTMFPTAETIILVCTTAPTIFLANAIRQRLEPMCLILDVGHYFDERRKRDLRSLEGTKEVVVVQDVIDTEKTIGTLTDLLVESGVSISAVVTLISLSNSCLAGTIKIGGVVEKTLGLKTTRTSIIRLFELPASITLNEEQWSALPDSNRFWVEPYSMHPYRLNVLQKAPHEQIGSIPYADQFRLLADWDALRVGHFIFESHHYSIITRTRSIFEDSEIAVSRISRAIAELCVGQATDIVLVCPLHSHIRYLLPTLIEELQSRRIEFSYVLATMAREFGPRPYYLIPKKLELLIQERHRFLKNADGPKICVVLIDDSASTGRTIETLLRSISLVDRAAAKAAHTESAISRIDVFAVINRMGRAKSDFFTKIDKWSGIPFSFSCLMAYDAPVYEEHECPLCKELLHIETLKRVVDNSCDQPLQRWLSQRVTDLSPIIVDTPRFESVAKQSFPKGISFSFDEHRADSAELAEFLFFEKAERGCPARTLLDVFRVFTEAAMDHCQHSAISHFRSFVWDWILHNWDRIASDIADELVFEMFARELTIAPECCARILHTSTHLFQKHVLPYSSHESFISRAFTSLKMLVIICQESPTRIDMRAREQIFLALLVVWINLTTAGKPDDDTIKTFRNKINELPSLGVYPGDFQGSMQHTFINAVEFTKPAKPNFLECLKLATMELLSAPIENHRKLHANRLSTHLRRLANDPPAFVRNDTERIRVFGSIDFLERRSLALMSALRTILVDANHFDLLLSRVSGSFDALIQHLRLLSTSSENAISWKIVSSTLLELENFLFSKTSEIVKEMKCRNVSIEGVLEQVRLLADQDDVANRLLILDQAGDLGTPPTVFADEAEFLNLICNHTVDVLREGIREQPFSIGLVIERIPGNDEKICFRILSNRYSADKDIKRVIRGHGLRLEGWGLRPYGFSSTVSPSPEVPTEWKEMGLTFTLEMRFDMIRGYH